MTVGQCEWADYPTKILERHWPDVPRWRDIRTLTKESFYEKTGLRTVDIISGGFPCQPFSVAGKQKAKGDDRYLWPEMLRVIRELKPRWVLGENVPGIIRLAAWDVVSSLEREGFDAVVFDLEAAAVGAPHRRERICFLANANSDARKSWRPESEGQQRKTGIADGCDALANAKSVGLHDGDDSQNERQTNREIHASTDAGVVCGEGPVAYSGGEGLQRLEQHGTPHTGQQQSEPCGSAGKCGETVSDTRRWGRDRDDGREHVLKPADLYEDVPHSKSAELYRSQPSAESPRIGGLADRCRLTGQWAVEPDVGRVAHGVPNRVDRIKCLGNAVVPQQFYPFFKAIADIERGKADENPDL